MKKFIRITYLTESSVLKKTFINAIILLTLAGLISCDNSSPKTDTSVVVQNDTVKEESTTSSNSNTTSNEKIIEEVVTASIDLTKTVIKNLKVNDSIRVANREQMFAYQIGLPIANKEDVFEEYDKLEDTESVYVLEKSRKEFYIIKYEGKTKDELNEGLEEYKKRVPSTLSGTAKVINLMSLCSKRDKLMVGESLTMRKKNNELPCLICK